MTVFSWRNKSLIATALFLPFIVSLLYGLAIGAPPRDLHLAVVNEDFPCSQGVPALPAGCYTQDVSGLSCRFLSSLNQRMFILDQYDDIPAAQQAVRGGLAWGSLHFPANYSLAMQSRVTRWRDASSYDLDHSEVDTRLDMSNQQVSEMIRLALIQSSIKYAEDLMVGCDGNKRFKLIPLQINEPIYGPSYIDFRDFFFPALFLQMIYHTCALYTLAGFVDDKRDGFMERSVTSGVSVLEVLWAHVMVDTIMMVAMTIVSTVMVCGVFGATNNGSLVTLFLLCCLNGLSGMFEGYFIASLCTTDFAGIFCLICLYLPLLVLSGMMWPVEGMHYTLQNAVWVLPLNLATTAIRAIMTKGWGWGHTDVRDGFLSTLGWLAFFLVVTVITLKTKKHVA